MSSLETGSKKTIQRYYMKMKYQERQFLRAQDFQDEQDYHVQKMKDHNRLLHTRGVCEGLLVTASKTELCVDVSAGSAIDAIGNPIMLAEKETVDLSKSCPGATSIILTIRYGQANAPDKEYNPDEGGFSGCTRTLEKPVFEAWPAASPSTDANCLLLAAITRNTAGTILTCNSSPLGRLTAGVQLSAVGSGELLAQSVTTDKIKDGAVTEIKLAGNAVTAAKLAVNAVTTEKINAAAVTDLKLATDAVITAKIKDANVTAAKLAVNAVTTEKINAAAVTDLKLASNAVTTVKIKDANVTAAKLATDAVTTVKIKEKAVSYEKMNCYRKTWTISTIKANSALFYSSGDITEEQLLLPMMFFVYPLDDNVAVFSMQGTNDNVYWYERAIKKTGLNTYERGIFVNNKTNKDVRLRISFWRWE
ncbi:MAG: hypothetical protein LBB91_05410 [Clostridiales bacterium]|jgi:hypothetical protein|nr:hypothetical protein [Clostridiales bacterium]